MVKITFEVRNKDRVRQRLNAMVPGLDAELGASLAQSADEVAALATRFAPVRTGELRESINAKRIDDSGGEGVTLGRAVSRARFVGPSSVGRAQAVKTLAWGVFAHFKWRFVEFGTVHSGAQPFMFPAYGVLRRPITPRARRVDHPLTRQA